MFACFSKKKKAEPSSPHLPKSNSEGLTNQESTQTTNNHHPQSIKSNQKKSKFCPITPAQCLTAQCNPPQQPMSISLNKIDDILERQLQYCSQNLMEEETAFFGKRMEQVQQNWQFVLPQEGNHQFEHYLVFKDTKSMSMSESAFPDLPLQEDINSTHHIPSLSSPSIHTLASISEKKSYKSRRSRRKTKQIYPNSIKGEQMVSQNGAYDIQFQQSALDTTISLEKLKLPSQRICYKVKEELQDDLLNQTLQQAQNSFYCAQGSLIDEFERAIICNNSPQLPKRIYRKMNSQDKNKVSSKGYTCVQLLVLKSIACPCFLELAKDVVYDVETKLEGRGPTGWTPLQDALAYRNIPLATHIFKASYNKKQQEFQTLLSSFSSILSAIPNFQLEVSVKVDSFIPLIGALTPSDTLKILKVGQRLELSYSLVGYQFPSCKRRDMQILFDGSHLWGVNRTKKIYCDLLETLDYEEMVLMVEDMLTSQIKRSYPIIHSLRIDQSLSIFQNPIQQEIAGKQASLYALQIRYTSTAQKREPQPQTQPSTQVQPQPQTRRKSQLSYLSNYSAFKQRNQMVTIKQKNRNKKVELEVWLCKDFGLQLSQLLSILEILSMGNSLISQWSKFLRNQVGQTISQKGLFPVKIDIPLDYSLYFNIEFASFRHIENNISLSLDASFEHVKRKDFQGTLQSKEKRAVFIKAYT